MTIKDSSELGPISRNLSICGQYYILLQICQWIPYKNLKVLKISHQKQQKSTLCWRIFCTYHSFLARGISRNGLVWMTCRIIDPTLRLNMLNCWDACTSPITACIFLNIVYGERAVPQGFKSKDIVSAKGRLNARKETNIIRSFVSIIWHLTCKLDSP